MTKFLKCVICLFLLQNFCTQFVEAKHLYPEKYYQNQWCSRWGGQAEYKLKDKTRVDCLTKNYAVEFDFAPKWAESYGQAVHYSDMTGKKPAIILIIEKSSDWKHYNKLKAMCNKHGVTLWYMKSPMYITTPTKSIQNIDIQFVFLQIKNLIEIL